MIDEKLANRLLNAAKIAQRNAYAPYSHYRVGAALLATNGKTYIGCNVENASFGVTNCAERTALFSAIADGAREFIALAVVGGIDNTFDNSIVPCGICRQALVEFCKEDFPVILKNNNTYRIISLGDFLPHSFSPKNLS